MSCVITKICEAVECASVSSPVPLLSSDWVGVEVADVGLAEGLDDGVVVRLTEGLNDGDLMDLPSDCTA